MQVLVNGRGENMKGELLKSVACRKGYAPAQGELVGNKEYQNS